jgi:hypothetical protein
MNMTAFKSAFLIFFLSCAALALPKSSLDGTGFVEWNFEVFLENTKVGYHNFRLEQDDDRQTLVSEAKFKVKLLFLTLYKYQHENSETWQGDCLQRIESTTNANGKKFTVIGSQGPEVFEVQATGVHNEVPGCVKSFAYWNPDFLKEPVLMNPQTGEVLPITVELLAEETVTVRGQEVTAQRYRLQAKGTSLDLWYSKDREWLGLESTTKDGHTIRYELS